MTTSILNNTDQVVAWFERKFDEAYNNVAEHYEAQEEEQRRGFDITAYNEMRRLCMNEFGFTYKQLFGLKYWELTNLYFNDCSVVLYKITGKKRHWLRMKLEDFLTFIDPNKG